MLMTNCMKRTIISILAGLLFMLPASAQSDWYGDKYSMFIHFGLYSHFGGVWDGEPVKQGYSEQIQSFAGIFSDWYARTAYEFTPVNFDAEQIAKLAVDSAVNNSTAGAFIQTVKCVFTVSDRKVDCIDDINVDKSGTFRCYYPINFIAISEALSNVQY